jgi:hypothetical protein
MEQVTYLLGKLLTLYPLKQVKVVSTLRQMAVQLHGNLLAQELQEQVVMQYS